MKLFHQLEKLDQDNVVHYCLHLVIDDMLADGVQLEPFDDEGKQAKEILERVIGEAKKLPEEERFSYVLDNTDAGAIIFDIALDLARSAYLHSSDEQVIFYEDLRQQMEANKAKEPLLEETFEEKIEDININVKKDKHSLN